MSLEYNINMKNTQGISLYKNLKPHKFFERFLDNDLDEAKENLTLEYKRIATGKMSGVRALDDVNDIFTYTKSYSTQKSREYNAFQMYYPWIHDVYSSVVDMVREACDYYGIDYNSEQWMCQSWFNINSNDGGKMLGWHDHVQEDFDGPAFHGYYSINAEPSNTFYRIGHELKTNENKNNRAILSMAGFEHAMGPWESDENRITLAYDIVPIRSVLQKEFLKLENLHEKNLLNLEKPSEPFWEQHYFPLPKITEKR